MITPTAEVHRHAWRAMFDEFFADRGIVPAYTEDDYFSLDPPMSLGWARLGMISGR